MAQSALIGHVEHFQLGADDWEQYTERLQQYFIANGISDDSKKLATFLTVIGPSAYALLSNLVAPEKPASKTYDELVATMKSHVKPKPLVIAERFRFHRRDQAESECVSVHGGAAQASRQVRIQGLSIEGLARSIGVRP